MSCVTAKPVQEAVAFWCQLLTLTVPQLAMAPCWANAVFVGLQCKPDQDFFFFWKKKKKEKKSDIKGYFLHGSSKLSNLQLKCICRNKARARQICKDLSRGNILFSYPRKKLQIILGVLFCHIALQIQQLIP